jgi:CheY-like chemotaxis protein
VLTSAKSLFGFEECAGEPCGRTSQIQHFMSGYSHRVLAPEGLAEQGANSFIEKPFSAIELLHAVRDLLDARVEAK